MNLSSMKDIERLKITRVYSHSFWPERALLLWGRFISLTGADLQLQYKWKCSEQLISLESDPCTVLAYLTGMHLYMGSVCIWRKAFIVYGCHQVILIQTESDRLVLGKE